MSFPSIPDVNTSAEFSRKDSLNLLLASVAFEEFGLARLIDAEAKKIQHVLDSHKGGPHPKQPVTVEQILAVNKSVDQVLRDIIKKELLLLMKLESVLADKKPRKPYPSHPGCDKKPDEECGC